MTEAIKADPKKRRIFYILMIILALVITIWVGIGVTRRIRANRKLQEQERVGQENAGGNPGSMTQELGDEFPLIKGSEGERVQYLQNAINKINHVYGKPAISVDGKFGQGTKDAVLLLGTKYFPVTQTAWTEILNRANKLSA